MAPCFAVVATAVLACAATASAAKAYQVQDVYDPTNVGQTWDFFQSRFGTGNNNDIDPTAGFVNYRSYSDAKALGVLSETKDSFTIKPDFPKGIKADGVGPNSARLESKARYNKGLFIADFSRFPKPVCGSWPAFWMFGDPWPTKGELDIYEGWNEQEANGIALHTDHAAKVGSCRLDPVDQVADTITTNCDNYFFNPPLQYEGTACLVKERNGLWGAATGGVYAVEWSSRNVSVWSWAHADTPADVLASRPNPRTWGRPHFLVTDATCDVERVLRDQKLVLNLDFCGVTAGNDAIWGQGCRAKTGAATCAQYVAANPRDFDEVAFGVKSIKVYQHIEVEEPKPTSTAETSSAASSTAASSSTSSSTSSTADATTAATTTDAATTTTTTKTTKKTSSSAAAPTTTAKTTTAETTTAETSPAGSSAAQSSSTAVPSNQETATGTTTTCDETTSPTHAPTTKSHEPTTSAASSSGAATTDCDETVSSTSATSTVPAPSTTAGTGTTTTAQSTTSSSGPSNTAVSSSTAIPSTTASSSTTTSSTTSGTDKPAESSATTALPSESTTSTITTTRTYTITSCAPTETRCPLGQVTSEVVVTTTICPVTTTTPSVLGPATSTPSVLSPATPTPSVLGPATPTPTMLTYTVTSCGPAQTGCTVGQQTSEAVPPPPPAGDESTTTVQATVQRTSTVRLPRPSSAGVPANASSSAAPPQTVVTAAAPLVAGPAAGVLALAAALVAAAVGAAM